MRSSVGLVAVFFFLTSTCSGACDVLLSDNVISHFHITRRARFHWCGQRWRRWWSIRVSTGPRRYERPQLTYHAQHHYRLHCLVCRSGRSTYAGVVLLHAPAGPARTKGLEYTQVVNRPASALASPSIEIYWTCPDPGEQSGQLEPMPLCSTSSQDANFKLLQLLLTSVLISSYYSCS